MPKLKCILDKLPNVSTIIYFEDQLVKTDLKGFERIRTFSYSDVIQYGIKNPVGKFLLILILQSRLGSFSSFLIEEFRVSSSQTVVRGAVLYQL